MDILSFDPPFGIENFLAALDCIAQYVFNIGVILGLVMILVSAFLFLTSGGEPERISTAKRALLWSVIGIVAVILMKGFMFAILTFFGVDTDAITTCSLT